jgi:tripartite-type tricarboxylate transporter receptor subunit TctC
MLRLGRDCPVLLRSSISGDRGWDRFNARSHTLTLPRRTFLQFASAAATAPAFLRVARAQTYPARPVRLIVGFPAGGIVDVFGRLMAQSLSERLGQPFVVENRLGASSNIAVEAVVKSSPDGYTLLMINSTNAFNASLYEKLNFNLIADLTPVASIYRDATGVMVVNPLFPTRTVSEFITYAKANPGKINMASSGIGVLPACLRRTVQDDGRCRSGPRTVSRGSTGADRSDWRSSRRHF